MPPGRSPGADELFDCVLLPPIQRFRSPHKSSTTRGKQAPIKIDEEDMTQAAGFGDTLGEVLARALHEVGHAREDEGGLDGRDSIVEVEEQSVDASKRTFEDQKLRHQPVPRRRDGWPACPQDTRLFPGLSQLSAERYDLSSAVKGMKFDNAESVALDVWSLRHLASSPQQDRDAIAAHLIGWRLWRLRRDYHVPLEELEWILAHQCTPASSPQPALPPTRKRKTPHLVNDYKYEPPTSSLRRSKRVHAALQKDDSSDDGVNYLRLAENTTASVLQQYRREIIAPLERVVDILVSRIKEGGQLEPAVERDREESIVLVSNPNTGARELGPEQAHATPGSSIEIVPDATRMRFQTLLVMAKEALSCPNDWKGCITKIIEHIVVGQRELDEYNVQARNPHDKPLSARIIDYGMLDENLLHLLQGSVSLERDTPGTLHRSAIEDTRRERQLALDIRRKEMELRRHEDQRKARQLEAYLEERRQYDADEEERIRHEEANLSAMSQTRNNSSTDEAPYSLRSASVVSYNLEYID
ncbi:hypothetical protein HGRIS_003197 [Hohenbuehelia grisea]|uniref:Uncharacterized protein n=1 Tax=Hohenbuehelia grisea TaxID=104357 RepID=A0ABR3JMR4_9AGAR